MPAVALIAGAGLAYEILLLRLFAIAQWQNFAYLAISLALLGIGVAGTLLALAGRRARGHAGEMFALAAAGFAVTAPASWAMAQRVPFNALAIYWDGMQPLWFVAQYLLLLLPFLCVGVAVCVALQARPARSAGTYGADLVGAGVGAAAVVGLLFVLSPSACLRVIAMTGAGAALLAGTPRMRLLAAAAAATAVLTPAAWLAPQPSPYKSLSLQMNAPGATVVARRSSPLAELTLVASPEVPVRHAPGLSLASPYAPPPQFALFTDAGEQSAVLQPGTAPPRYLDWMTSALPYALLRRPRTLILGLGGGTAIWQARLHGAKAVTAVTVNRQRLALLRNHGGNVLHGVEVHVSTPRAFARRDASVYDLIVLEIADAAGAGANSLEATYDLTVAAFADYLAHLSHAGILAMTLTVDLPPRAALKAFATAAAALGNRGAAVPGRHLAMIRGWKTVTLVAGNQPLAPSAIQAVRDFAHTRSFDLVHLPGLDPTEVNRHNRLAKPTFHRATQALLGPHREQFFEDYPYHIRPATWQRPYFFHFFKWSLLPNLFAQRAIGGLTHIEAAYPILVFALVQAVAAAILLILLPLAARTGDLRHTPVRRARLLALCLALGLGFLFIEIAFIQRLTFILGHPLYAVALVLAGFLVFAGAGAACATRLGDRIWPAVAGIAVLAGAYAHLLPVIAPALAVQSAAVRVAACLGLIAPLAFCMGMPYARALARLGQTDSAIIPWAWGINGCASVAASMLATLLAVHLGIDAVVFVAIGLYLVAALCYRF